MSVFGKIDKIASGFDEKHSLVTIERKFPFHTRQKILSVENSQLRGFESGDTIRGKYDKDDSLSELTELRQCSINECPKCGCESDSLVVDDFKCCKFFPETLNETMWLSDVYGDSDSAQLRLVNNKNEQFLTNWISNEHYLFKKLTGLEPENFYNIIAIPEQEHVELESSLVNAIEILDVN